MLDREYTTIGYTSVWVNNLDDTIGYGTYNLDLYAPPIYVEELDPGKILPVKVKLTLVNHKPYDPYDEPAIDDKWQDKRYKKYKMLDAEGVGVRPTRIATPDSVDENHRVYKEPK